MHAFGRRTDRRRDTFLIASQRRHSMQRGNNESETRENAFYSHTLADNCLIAQTATRHNHQNTKTHHTTDNVN